MALSCEVCGAPIRGPPASVEIDGAVMRVCPKCATRGRRLSVPVAAALPRHQAPRSLSAPRPTRDEEYFLEPDYGARVRKAREGLGLSQEELGRRMNVKSSVVSHVEAQKLKPDRILIKKLEHELKVVLVAAE